IRPLVVCVPQICLTHEIILYFVGSRLFATECAYVCTTNQHPQTERVVGGVIQRYQTAEWIPYFLRRVFGTGCTSRNGQYPKQVVGRGFELRAERAGAGLQSGGQERDHHES